MDECEQGSEFTVASDHGKQHLNPAVALRTTPLKDPRKAEWYGPRAVVGGP
jgi:hypothetical protein